MSHWGGIVCAKVLSGWENESAAMKGEGVPGRGVGFYKGSESRKYAMCSRNNRGLHGSGMNTEWDIDHEMCQVRPGPLDQDESSANHCMFSEQKAHSLY